MLLDNATNTLQEYRNRAITDKARYAREFKAVFNRDPLFVEREKAATA